MKFRTELVPNPIQPPLRVDDRVMVLGSCFAENIGRRLLRGGMVAHLNPLGIQYNPLSLQKVMAYLSGEADFQADGAQFFRSGASPRRRSVLEGHALFGIIVSTRHDHLLK